ncbi:MAG: rod shape-determining protein MreC [Phycisphaerae bacterium]|nr:rod shape-determining protein MreC [Phycisphaerae bacterium]NUQ46386.1 rod shape-determining protein MreC [Phycisphaerae bacterium]
MPLIPQRSRKQVAFWGLMGLGALALFLPPEWTNRLKNLTQLLVPMQSPLSQWSRGLADQLHGLRPESSAGDANMERQVAALQHQVVAMAGHLEQLRDENSRLRGFRERYRPSGVLLVPARVVARDIDSWRDGLLLSRGLTRDVQRNDLVTSRLFVGAGSTERVAVGHLVLARETLLGMIEHVGPFTSRLRLFSDVGNRVEVRVGRAAGGKFVMVDYPCTLVGRGNGQMMIENVPVHFIEEHAGGRGTGPGMKIGDLVATPGAPPDLPTPMVIGRVAEFQVDARKRLFANVRVVSMVRPDEIGEVLIVATGNLK